MLFHTLFMDTKKLLLRAGANPGFGDGGGIYGERGARAYIGVLGLRPQWYLVAKPLVGSRGKAP